MNWILKKTGGLLEVCSCQYSSGDCYGKAVSVLFGLEVRLSTAVITGRIYTHMHKHKHILFRYTELTPRYYMTAHWGDTCFLNSPLWLTYGRATLQDLRVLGAGVNWNGAAGRMRLPLPKIGRGGWLAGHAEPWVKTKWTGLSHKSSFAPLKRKMMWIPAKFYAKKEGSRCFMHAERRRPDGSSAVGNL